MKKANLRFVLAWLLALCLLLGSLPVLAEETASEEAATAVPEEAIASQEAAGEAAPEEPTVTIDASDKEHATVTVDVGEVKETDAYVGLNVYAEGGIYANGTNIPFDGEEEYEGDRIGTQLTEAGVTHTDSLTVNADSVTVEGTEDGVGIEVSRYEDYLPEDDPDTFYMNDADEVNINVAGDVNVEVEGKGDVGATGIVSHEQYEDEMNFVEPVNVQTGSVIVTATATGESDDGDEPYARADGIWINEMFGTTNVEVSGDVAASASNGAVGIYGVSGGNWEVWDEWYPPKRETDQNGELNITVNGDITAEGGEWAYGIDTTAATSGYRKYDESESSNGSNVVVVQNEDGSGAVIGTSDAMTVSGSIYDVGGTVNVTVNGDVNAKGDNSVGMSVCTANNATSTITVTGDVAAVGEKGIGLQLWQNQRNASTDVLVGGTLSGGDVAIEAISARGWKDGEDGSFQTDVQFDPLSANIYAWQIAENSDGEIARVYDEVHGVPSESGKPVDAEASAKLEAAIWYIAKAANAALTVTGTKKTVDGTDYQVAHQDENVKLAFELDEAEEGLDGILYNADDKTAAKADEWGRNDDGSYWVKMLRGGGMLLGLSTHKHQKATREENRVEATCTKDGSYDLVTYCTVCNRVLSTEKKAVPATGHTAGAAVRENEVAATCAKAGSYDEVVYCSVCKAEISRTKKAVDMLAHTPAEAVHENIVAAQPGVMGGYDSVVYCSACKTELSREHVATPALPVEEAPAADPAPAPEYEFVYEDVGENVEVNGVKAADHPEAAEALATVGESLDGEGETVTVEIPGAEKLMDEEEFKTFEKLPVKDRLLVVLSALGFANDEQGDATEGMSDEAKSLSAAIGERMASLPEDEKQALLNSIAAQFPKRTVTVDGQECKSFSIDLVIDRNGNKSYERYTFYDADGAWKLYGIEKGVYREV